MGEKIKSAIGSLQGTVGVAVHLNGAQPPIFVMHEDGQFPMMSVFKFPLALAILKEVDRKNLSLQQEVQVSREMLDPDTWSPMREQFPQGGTFKLSQLLQFVVASSDNNACEILFGIIGGPEKVQGFLSEYYGKDVGIKIVCSEEAFKDTAMIYANYSTPLAMNRLLEDLYLAAFKDDVPNSIVSKESAQFLWEIMSHTKLAATCLRGDLPPGVVLANKTGYSGVRDGVIIARNDVGVMLMPDGRHAVVSVFIRDCKATLTEMEKTISRIGRIVAEELQQPSA